MDFKFKTGDPVCLKGEPNKGLTVEFSSIKPHKGTGKEEIVVTCKHFDDKKKMYFSDEFIEDMLDFYKSGGGDILVGGKPKRNNTW